MNLIVEQLGILSSRLIPRGIAIPILKGPLRKTKWIVGAAPGPARGLGWILNLVEPEQLGMAKRLIHSNDICFDIGANVGSYTLLFAKYAKHVFAFEPLPRNVRYLVSMLEINKTRNATVVPCAISNFSGLSSFRKGENWGIGKLDNKGEQPVVVVSCDEFAKFYSIVPSLLKIDVEGAELNVLTGARNLIAKYKPTLLLSTHGQIERESSLAFCTKMNYSQIIPLNHKEITYATEYAILA